MMQESWAPIECFSEKVIEMSQSNLTYYLSVLIQFFPFGWPPLLRKTPVSSHHLQIIHDQPLCFILPPTVPQRQEGFPVTVCTWGQLSRRKNIFWLLHLNISISYSHFPCSNASDPSALAMLRLWAARHSASTTVSIFCFLWFLFPFCLSAVMLFTIFHVLRSLVGTWFRPILWGGWSTCVQLIFSEYHRGGDESPVKFLNTSQT